MSVKDVELLRRRGPLASSISPDSRKFRFLPFLPSFVTLHWESLKNHPPELNVAMTLDHPDDDLFEFDDGDTFLGDSATHADVPGQSSGRRQAAARWEDKNLDEEAPTSERLQKLLASAGLASRRHCEEYITDGRVTVDGKTVRTLGIKVNPEVQQVCVDGERIKPERKRHFLVNKPSGVHCTNADPMGRIRVIDLLPPSSGRLFTVGRLDEGSEGLILVTNDGELAHKLAHPKFQVERVYRALIAGTPADETLRQLRQGLYFTEGKFRVRDIRRIKTNGNATIVEVILTEGQNREVRRLFARVGHKVMKLKRVGFGPLRLGDLPTGAVRPLLSGELKILQQFAETSPNRRMTSQARPKTGSLSSVRAPQPAAKRSPSSGLKSPFKRGGKPAKRSSPRGRSPS